MRIAVVNSTGGGFSGGYRKYLINMLPRLSEHRDVSALLCVSPHRNDVQSWFAIPPRGTYSTCSRLNLKHVFYVADKKMAKSLAQFSPDVLFMPLERYIKFKDVPAVNMIRNMEPFADDMKNDPIRTRFKKFVQRRIARNSIKRTNHTIAVSDFVSELLFHRLHAPKTRFTKIYHGVSAPAAGGGKRPSSIPTAWEEKSFFFTAGSIRPARGLEDAVAAIMRLRELDVEARVVIAGDTAHTMLKYRSDLKRTLALNSLSEGVCWAGNLNDEEMRWCYERCAIFIMTSRVEACPNIALEAMSHGCVSISANSLPLPEFFGDTAVYYEQGNAKSLESAMRTVLSWDNNKRGEVSARAKGRAAQFSWDICATKTIEVLKNAAASRK